MPDHRLLALASLTGVHVTVLIVIGGGVGLAHVLGLGWGCVG